MTRLRISLSRADILTNRIDLMYRGTLSVEYRPVQDEVKVGQDVDWDSMYQSLSADMKKTKITTVTEGGQQRYQFDFSGVHEGLRNTGIDLIISSIDNAVGTELDEWKSLGETLYQFGGYFVSGLDEDRYIAASHSDPVEYTLMFAKDSADLSKRSSEGADQASEGF